MINNNPYNIPQKKPLSQSKIISQTNSSRHSSTYLQNRNGNQVMYSSSIFLKNPPANGPCDQSFFEPIKQPLSPHHAKYSKAPSTVQFIPSYNLPPMRPPENHFFPVAPQKENPVERSLFELRQKIDKIEKRLDAREMKESSLNNISSKKQQNLLESDSMASLTEDSSNNGNGLRQLVSLMIDQAFEVQNKKIWQKLGQIQQQSAFSSNGQLGQKLSLLQESVFRLQTEKTHNDEHLVNRLKTIEKTIRQMGEDIHLINDKEESLSGKIQVDLPALRNEVAALRAVEKKVTETDKKTLDMDKKMLEIKGSIDQVNKKLKLLEVSSQTNISMKIKEIDTKIQAVKSLHKDIKPTFEKYLSQPCVLKYIEKYQISKPIPHSYSNSTKQSSCQQIVINEITYFIDHEGYLLDNDRYYLISSTRNERIRLDAKHIDMLKERKILI